VLTLIFKIGQRVCCFLCCRKGWQHFHYVYSLPNCVFVTRLTGPNIIDTPLTLIFKMGQVASRFFLCPCRMATLAVCVITTKSRLYYATYRTNTYWCCVDAYFATGISTIYCHFIWWIISLMVIWQPFYWLRVLSSLSLHCSLIIHINRFFKTYYRVSGNCR